MSGIELGAVEQRILGCLMEKQRTTPDAYPLSLNALRLACNQSTNRDPVVEYDETTLRDGLHRLERRGLVRLASGAGSRASKFRHLLAQALPMDDAEQSVICVLLLRGAQTPGELKQRTDRMHPFASLDEVQATLHALIDRELVCREGRRPGQKEDRYRHLLDAEEQEGESAGTTDSAASMPASPTDDAPANGAPAPARDPEAAAASTIASELAALAERVGRLERELSQLRAAD
jgi:uncharacterized protein